MPRAPKACGHHGCPVRVTGRTYCDEHLADKRRFTQSPSSKAAEQRSERNRRRIAVAAWVAVNGWVCPGWQRPPHASDDLTAAHSHAVARGGTDSLLTVLCRSCNGRQGTRDT